MAKMILADINAPNASIKTYKTEENLIKALDKLGLSKYRFLVVNNAVGRYTAIFPFSEIQDGDATKFARFGFITLG